MKLAYQVYLRYSIDTHVIKKYIHLQVYSLHIDKYHMLLIQFHLLNVDKSFTSFVSKIGVGVY